MKKWSLYLLLLLLFITNDAEAQCAMCKAVVESNVESGSAIGSGLNDGILYLMAMPYVSVALIAFFWVRHNKRQKK